MTRYYAIATVLVVLFVGIVVGFGQAGRRLDVRSPDVEHPGSPSRPRAAAALASGATAEPFDADAPWALSALPECYAQIGSLRDFPDVVRRHVPRVAEPLPAGSTLRTGTCALDVGPRGLTIRRGPDRFRVGGVQRFFLTRDPAHGEVLVLLRQGDGLPELRRYTLRLPSRLSVPGRGARIARSNA